MFTKRRHSRNVISLPPIKAAILDAIVIEALPPMLIGTVVRPDHGKHSARKILKLN